MTTISSALPAQSSGSASSEIAGIYRQITKLTQQLKELADSSLGADEKQKQQELIQSQIAMLQAQLAMLQSKQLEKSQQEQAQAEKVEGVNRPSADNQIDIYI
ncbi:FlxA-like family protein [Superficieibacter sp. 1612_C1]|uniref:FlxA-like family protein n=1 Tax=Superficieibacter sp. 1612_C1 TaxID=2780382 RepID=UPI00188373EA|nr:FlxA-like family protein [Superficieibacter sp. 1612_C1]